MEYNTGITQASGGNKMLCQRLKFAKRDGFWGSFYGQWWDNYHIEQIKPGSFLFEELKEAATAHVYPTFTSFQYY